MYFRLTTLKMPPSNVMSTIFVCNFLSLWAPPMILLTAGALTDSCPRELQTCTRLMQGWVASAGWHRPGGIDRVASAGWHRPGGIDRVASAGWPPKQKSWQCRCDGRLNLIAQVLEMCFGVEFLSTAHLMYPCDYVTF